MGRNANEQLLDTICQFVQQHSEHKAGSIARALSLDNKTLMRVLVQLEDRGDLLAQDDQGRLSWFGKRQE